MYGFSSGARAMCLLPFMAVPVRAQNLNNDITGFVNAVNCRTALARHWVAQNLGIGLFITLFLVITVLSTLLLDTDGIPRGPYQTRRWRTRVAELTGRMHGTPGVVAAGAISAICHTMVTFDFIHTTLPDVLSGFGRRLLTMLYGSGAALGELHFISDRRLCPVCSTILRTSHVYSVSLVKWNVDLLFILKAFKNL